jgi:hypothetical protein
MEENFNIPVLFLVFNRLDTAKQVFAIIRQIKPRYFYIAADGARNDKPGEREKCAAVRQYILDNIDWPCEVKTLFRDKNLGCKMAVSGAISWFFQNEEWGIILEDDCLPDLSFFPFCQELLEKYKNDETIAVISGDDFNPDKVGDGDYYLSRIPHIWGWATWRRTWEKYDVAMAEFPRFKKDGAIKKIWSNKRVQNYWIDILSEVYQGKIDTWDYQLTFSLFINNSFCICPNVNLVSNIGFGNEATHTLLKINKLQNIPSKTMSFPLVHPKEVVVNKKMDMFVNKKIFLKNYWPKLFLRKIGLFNLAKRFYLFIRK